MSKQTLLEKLTDKSYRDAFISDEIDIGLPMQLRAMREAREWNQGYVAERTETKQPRFSLMEKPGYGKYSLSTLKKLASLFDVGLIVSFVPYSEMIDFTEAFNRRRLAICGFAEEYPRLAKRYARTSAPIQDTLPSHRKLQRCKDTVRTWANLPHAPNRPVVDDALDHQGVVRVDPIGKPSSRRRKAATAA